MRRRIKKKLFKNESRDDSLSKRHKRFSAILEFPSSSEFDSAARSFRQNRAASISHLASHVARFDDDDNDEMMTSQSLPEPESQIADMFLEHVTT